MEVQGGCVLKDFEGPIVEQENKGLHCEAKSQRTRGQIWGQIQKPGLGPQTRSQDRKAGNRSIVLETII